MAQAHATRAVAAQTLNAERELLGAVRVRVEVGERAASEIAVQQKRVAAAQGDVLAAEQEQRLAEARLVRVLDPTAEYTFPVPDAAAVPASAHGLVEQALVDRADLRAADATVRAAEAQRRAARSGRLPRVAVSAFVGTNYSSGAGAGLSGQFGDNRAGRLGLSVSLPVFDGGRAGARVRPAEAQTLSAEVAAEVAAEDARRAVALEVRERLVALDAVRSRTTVAEARVAAARAALDAEQARCLAGDTALQDVTGLRTRLVEAETEVARLGVEARFAGLLLDAALGRPTSDWATGTG